MELCAVQHPLDNIEGSDLSARTVSTTAFHLLLRMQIVTLNAKPAIPTTVLTIAAILAPNDSPPSLSSSPRSPTPAPAADEGAEVGAAVSAVPYQGFVGYEEVVAVEKVVAD